MAAPEMMPIPMPEPIPPNPPRMPPDCIDGMDGRKPPAEIRCASARSAPQIDAAVTTAKAGNAHRAAERAPVRSQTRLQ
jgi:hypothetical protein